MFDRNVPLFKLFGFEVRLDPSWLILALLIIWSLAYGLFPSHYHGLSTSVYLWMGFFGAVGIFFSIVFHELCHSLIARKFGLPMKGITLFIFGGLAEMDQEPPSAKSEFFMAISGPIASVLLAVLFSFISQHLPSNHSTVPVLGVTKYLAWINMILAVFNMLPAFPLDGGRVLRSALWRWKGNLSWATKITSQIGSVFGLTLSFLGILEMFTGAFIGGMWLVLIGLFLRNAALLSYQQLIIRKTLEGEKVERFMKRDPVTVPDFLSIKDLVEKYIYQYHYKMFPVVNEGKLMGCVSTQEVKEVPVKDWEAGRVRDIMKNCSKINTLTPNTDAINALSIMNKTKTSRLMVVEGNNLKGIITLKDLLRFFALKLNLEGNEEWINKIEENI